VCRTKRLLRTIEVLMLTLTRINTQAEDSNEDVRSCVERRPAEFTGW
jgi:hypothetical protein